MAGRSVCCRNESKTCNYREVPRVTATAHAQSSPVRGHAAPADLSAGAHVTHAHPTVAVVRLPGGLGKRRDDDRACFPSFPLISFCLEFCTLALTRGISCHRLVVVSAFM
jgi:hypothetical protein